MGASDMSEQRDTAAPPLESARTYNNEPVTELLNELLVVLHDSRQGYLTAAEAIETDVYAAMFREYAAQREQMAVELSNLVARYHGEPEAAGSLTGSLHRVWMNIKAAATQGDESIMAECDLSEEATLKAYQNAFHKHELPEEVTEVIRQQMSHIRLAHERIHTLDVVLQN